MQTGLLWFDNNPARELTAKVEDAARRYKDKFGVAPNTCYVNKGAITGDSLMVALESVKGKRVRILPAPNILPHHFWIGVEEAREKAA